MFYPVVPSNHIQRAKVFVRRGTAYANIGNHELGMNVTDIVVIFMGKNICANLQNTHSYLEPTKLQLIVTIVMMTF